MASRRCGRPSPALPCPRSCAPMSPRARWRRAVRRDRVRHKPHLTRDSRMPTQSTADPASKAAVLAEALPYLRRYAGQTVLVKYGGHAMGNGDNGDPFARDIVLLKQVGINPIVVHGGGPQIGQMLQRLGIKSSFVDGLRVTDGETMEVVEMVLAGTVNKQLVGAINSAGGCAVGLSGKDGGLIRARKVRRSRVEDGVTVELD